MYISYPSDSCIYKSYGTSIKDSESTISDSLSFKSNLCISHRPSDIVPRIFSNPQINKSSNSHPSTPSPIAASPPHPQNK